MLCTEVLTDPRRNRLAAEEKEEEEKNQKEKGREKDNTDIGGEGQAGLRRRPEGEDGGEADEHGHLEGEGQKEKGKGKDREKGNALRLECPGRAQIILDCKEVIDLTRSAVAPLDRFTWWTMSLGWFRALNDTDAQVNDQTDEWMPRWTAPHLAQPALPAPATVAAPAATGTYSAGAARVQDLEHILDAFGHLQPPGLSKCATAPRVPTPGKRRSTGCSRGAGGAASLASGTSRSTGGRSRRGGRR